MIPHYRDLPRLSLCISALEQQIYGGEIEVIVADNDSPEKTAVAQATKGRCKLVIVTEKGAGPARNGGVEAARGEVIAFLDSDCLPEPGWIEAGVRGLQHFDFVGGRVRVSVAEPSQVSAVEAFERVFAFDFRRYIRRKGFTGAGNMFCWRTVFDHTGPFQSGVSEDVEWSHRARRLGFSLGYVPGAVVSHPARRSWAELQRKWRRLNAESYALASRWPAGRLIWLVRTLLLPGSALFHAPKVLLSRELDNPRQRLETLGVLFRIRLWRFAEGLRILFADGRP